MIKKFFLGLLTATLFFSFGFTVGVKSNFYNLLFRSKTSKQDFVMSMIRNTHPSYSSAILRIPGVFEGINNNVIVFIDSKNQRHELPIKNLTTPVQYWAALDNDLDVSISKDSFVAEATIIVTLGIDPYNGEIKTIWLELDKSRS